MRKKIFVNSPKDFILDKTIILNLISQLSKELNFKIASLEINFILQEEIHKLNKNYLNHNYSTDIITFNYLKEANNLSSKINSDLNIENKIDGEIFISIDDAKQNSKKYKVSFQKEIERLIIHGILHLLCYDDVDKKDRLIMKRKENYLVNKFEYLIK
ncbi:MAG: rRNA maturation RNase YbeY [Ignavibacterium sp.]